MKAPLPRSILDPRFRYRNSASTDIRLSFARARRRLKREAAAVPAVFRPRRRAGDGETLG